MKSSNHEFELYVLVDGRPIREYSHDQSIFIEGRDGSDYTIRMRNGTSARAAFVLSVDGLSVLDGKECADNSPSYVLNAGETLDVGCYKIDSDTGAKFVFGTKDDSYTAQMGKDTNNVGVIAARVFREQPVYSVQAGWSYTPWRTLTTPIHKGFTGDFAFNGVSTIQCSAGAMNSSTNSTVGGGLGTSNTSISNNTMAGTPSPMVNVEAMSVAMDSTDAQLGTVFGEAMEWKTKPVSFVKASVLPDASLVVYYDSRKNLEKRGIKFRAEPTPLPNPFPGNTGCPTPTAWHK